jgi:hypothetical protein
MTEEKVAPHFYVPRPRVEGNLTRNRGFVTAGDISANCEGTQSSGIPKTNDRLFFEAARVWDLGGQPASYSGKEYSRVFKEITGALTQVPRSANRSVGRSKNLLSVQRKLYQHHHSLYHRQHQQHFRQRKHHQQRQHRSLYCQPQHHFCRSYLHHTPYLLSQRSLA